MFIITEQPEILNMVFLFGIIGWLKSKFSAPTKESVSKGISTATKSIEHQRQYASSGRADASKASKKSADRPKQRRIRKQIDRNAESRGAYTRRTTRS